jgi:hypothetical protein
MLIRILDGVYVIPQEVAGVSATQTGRVKIRFKGNAESVEFHGDLISAVTEINDALRVIESKTSGTFR